MEEFERRADEAEKRLAALEAKAAIAETGISSVDAQKYEYQILMLKRAYDRHEKQLEDLNKTLAAKDAEIAALKAK